MNITNWELEVSCRFAGSQIVEPSINLKATLVCPHCEKTEDIRSNGHLIWGSAKTPLAELVGYQISTFTSVRDCAHCGMTFMPVPRAKQQIFSEGVHNVATNEWLERKLDHLRRHAKRQWEKPARKK